MYDLYNFKIEIEKQCFMPDILQCNSENKILKNLSFGTLMPVPKVARICLSNSVGDITNLFETQQHQGGRSDVHVQDTRVDVELNDLDKLLTVEKNF